MSKDKLLDKANSLPTSPGCYLMKSKSDEIIYVGKAKNLKSRVATYFNNSLKNTKTSVLVNHIVDFDFVLVETEAEALVLENNLIKKHTPKYNIRLKDDKGYPYILIDYSHPFPRLEYIRKWQRKREQIVFGPYPTGSNIREIAKIIRKNLRLRDCSNMQFKGRKHPCLLYQIGQCQAPCVGFIDKEHYLQQLQYAVDFLQGKTESFLEELSSQMHAAAEQERFELAAAIRDDLVKLKEFAGQSVQRHAEDLKGERNADIIGHSASEQEIDLAIFTVRNGILLGNKSFHFLSQAHCSVDEQLSSYLLQYYSKMSDSLPDRIVVSMEKESRQVLGDALQLLLTPHKCAISGNKGQFSAIARLVEQQAYENQRIRKEHRKLESIGLEQLQQILQLPSMPVVLECYDIAIWNGKSPTASQIVFHQGVPDKSSYRYYHLEERPEGNNDFAMMKEVLMRRLSHGKLPDVFIVDGGIGQVNVFVALLKELQLDIAVIGVAKERTRTDFKSEEIEKSEERLVIPGRLNPLPLKKYRELMMILVQMRDEAHRFSRKLHHLAEKKRIIPGN